MRGHKKWAWGALVAVLTTAPAVAQQGGVNSGGAAPTGSSSLLTPTSSSGSGFGSTAGSAGTGITSGNSGSGASSNGGSSQLSGTAVQQMQAAPKLAAPTGTATSSLQKSNFLAGFYANPYYQGLISSQTNAAPGGFGNALHGTGTGSVTTGGRGATGTTIGGRTGIGGQNANTQSGIVVQLPVQIAYTAQMQFPTPPVAPTRLQTDLRLAIDGTSMIANPKAVQIITDANNNITLRGTVKNDEELRLVEGMVRLTPGVGDIKNELTATGASNGK